MSRWVTGADERTCMNQWSAIFHLLYNKKLVVMFKKKLRRSVEQQLKRLDFYYLHDVVLGEDVLGNIDFLAYGISEKMKTLTI